MEDSGSSLAEIDSDCICHTVAGRPVKPKTLGQKAYVDAIRERWSSSASALPEPENIPCNGDGDHRVPKR